MKKIYDKRNAKNIPKYIKFLLDSCNHYKSDSAFGLKHTAIYKKLKTVKANPFSVIIFEEIIDSSHWNDKKYMKILKEKIISELDEIILDNFYNELNQKMSKYLEKHSDPDDIYWKKLVKEYHPQGIKLLKKRYKEFYPRAWKKKFNLKKIKEFRTRVIRERLYDMPVPFNYWDSRNLYQQYYIIPEMETVNKGGSGSSGQRETHSLYGFAYAMYNKNKKIPTYLFIYNRHNELKFIDKINELCLVTTDLGSNYHLDLKERKKILRGIHLVNLQRDKNIFGFSKIVIGVKDYI